MPIQEASVPDSLGSVLICVDRIADGDLCGRLCSPFTEHAAPFRGVLELVSRMERLFDRLCYPQPMFSFRSFRAAPRRRPARLHAARVQARRYHPDAIFESERGEAASFLVRVSHRRNATWQGAVVWMETGREQSFRSALELIRLIACALPGACAGWEA